MRDEWNTAAVTERGAQSVMTAGEWKMLLLSADSWVTLSSVSCKNTEKYSECFNFYFFPSYRCHCIH